jgi:hypothetical protein
MKYVALASVSIAIGVLLGVALINLAPWSVRSVGADHSFPDVDDGAYYHEDVGWLLDNGITVGCGGEPPAYCPNGNVTRGQMAAFLHRMAENVGVAGEQGPVGPEGPIGPKGDRGSQGEPGISDLEQVFENSAANSNTLKLVTVQCPDGKKVLGGGGFTTHSDAMVSGSYPSSDSAWITSAWEVSSIPGDWVLGAYATCATVAE